MYCPLDKFIGSHSQLLNNSEPCVASETYGEGVDIQISFDRTKK
jgi:hypothetical protein